MSATAHRTGTWANSSMNMVSAIAEYGKANKNAVTQRGFTGHEMVDEAGIIHMNGRIYDASIGRFLQADPIIDGATEVAGFNRYSYVKNNPLNAVDPTGYFSLKKELKNAWNEVRPFVGAIIGIVIAIYAPYLLQTWYGAFAAGFLSGAGGAAANGANLRDVLKGGVIGGVSSLAFFGVGRAFANMSNTGGCNFGSSARHYNFGGNYLTAGQVAGQISAHATVGGVVSVLQGGKFGHGFASAGITKSFSNLQMAASSEGPLAGALVAGVVGGTASAATGGKFANGFNTGTAQFLMNAWATHLAKSSTWVRSYAVKRAWKMEMKYVQKYGVGTRDWSAEELEMLKNGIKPPSYVGHHINSVKARADLAGNPNNIEFLNKAEHLAAHSGNWRTETWGTLLDRSITNSLLITASALDYAAQFDPENIVYGVMLESCNQYNQSACDAYNHFNPPKQVMY